MITLIFIAVFASVGFQFALQPLMILSFYREFLERLDKIWILTKPLGLCITCNSHWVAFILFYFNFPVFGSWLNVEASAIAVSGLSTLIWFLYNFLKNRI